MTCGELWSGDRLEGRRSCGKAYFALTEEAMTGSAAQMAGPWRSEHLDGVGHWLQLETPTW